MKEKDLYPDIVNWLDRYLKDKYEGYNIETTFETHKRRIDQFLNEKEKDIILPKEIIGLPIKVDIVSILRKENKLEFVLVEVKDKPLDLKDLGQLWGYTQLINPMESFLISSKGLGSLLHIFNVLKREDLLRYGKKWEKFMKIAKWDIRKKTIDYDTLIPKL